ncbi:MAG: 7-carboxy-7-deazaguanine synthase [Bacteroidota bacterium]
MRYRVKEIFYTLQGEGAHAGRPSVFCRFTGCNLWSGREEDRSDAICQFCDTDFRGTDGENGGKYTAEELVKKVADLWEAGLDHGKPFVVCTGGEPLLQLDSRLVKEFHKKGFEIAIETNGTKLPPDGIDWICVSPKAGAEVILKKGHELKLVFPQLGAEPELFAHLEFEHFYLQPMDGNFTQQNTQKAIQYCLRHPQWRLSIQTHKLLNIP